MGICPDQISSQKIFRIRLSGGTISALIHSAWAAASQSATGANEKYGR